MMSELSIKNGNSALADIFDRTQSDRTKSAVLIALDKLQYTEMEPLIKKGMLDKEEEVRATALSLLEGKDLSRQTITEITNGIFGKGSVKEQQQLLKVIASMPLAKTSDLLDNLLDKLKAKQLPPGIALELREAIEASKSASLLQKLSEIKPESASMAGYQDLLFGGNSQQGRQYFLTSTAGECARCHSVNKQGGAVGPALDNIGNVLSREQIAQALLDPSARISPGYGLVILTLKDGQSASGILSEENEEVFILKTSEAEPLKIPKARVSKRENIPSSMPPMGDVMSKREIRDLVEFLANLKSSPKK